VWLNVPLVAQVAVDVDALTLIGEIAVNPTNPEKRRIDPVRFLKSFIELKKIKEVWLGKNEANYHVPVARLMKVVEAFEYLSSRTS